MYRQAIEENPYVDEIWEIPVARRADVDPAWRRFASDAKRKRREGIFDEIFLTQVGPDNYQNFDGTVRASIFRAYPRPITVPVTPVIRLLPEEVQRVREFADRHGLERRKNVVLFECASASRQSFITPGFALDIAPQVLARIDDCAIVVTSDVRIESPERRIIDGSVLSFRENAELTKYCTLLVGCSSGVSWLCTSDWAKPLPTIQVLSKATSVFASMYHDAEYFGLRKDHILEMTDCSPEHLAECICAAMTEEFSAVRSRFHEQIPVELNFYLEVFMRAVLRQGQVLKIARSLGHVFRRYGPKPFKQYALSRLRLS